LHASPVVQALPSSHGPLTFACEHPAAPPQTSLVQPLPSPQRAFPPPSSVTLLQSSSTPLHDSVAPGWIAALTSSQSVLSTT
jgi:hypothetical protein